MAFGESTQYSDGRPGVLCAGTGAVQRPASACGDARHGRIPSGVTGTGPRTGVPGLGEPGGRPVAAGTRTDGTGKLGGGYR